LSLRNEHGLNFRKRTESLWKKQGQSNKRKKSKETQDLYISTFLGGNQLIKREMCGASGTNGNW